MTRPERPWHRDGIPAWGWLALIAMRLGSLVAMLLPFALLAAGLWWWTHGGRHAAPKLVQRAGEHTRAVADSVLGR